MKKYLYFCKNIFKMTAIALEKNAASKLYTFEEYLRKEERAVHKHEFFNGQILKMPGAKYRHNVVASNTITALNNAIEALEKEYIVLNSDQKIYIESENTSVYPDALVICEAPVFWQNREDILVNPLLIVEVVSRSTAAFDRTTKFWWYKSLPSFKEYIIIDPNKNMVETWFRIAEDTWVTKTTTELNESITLQSIDNITLSLSDIYKKINF
jgi:Uma2 family endonuclease